MKRLFALTLVLGTLVARRTEAQLVAEQVTRDNTARRLFSGSDANGGVGDWYLSNGIVEAIIDDASFAPDLAAAGVFVPIQNLLSPTGGTLIDLGLAGKNNDQFNQLFQVANIDPSNSFFYTKVKAAVTPQAATVTAEGVLLFSSVSTPAKPTLLVQTEYAVTPGTPFVTITSTVLNRGTSPVPVFNVTDAMPLSGRALLPFVPAPGRGFDEPVLELTPAGIAAAIEVYPFVALPGNLGPGDGLMDTVTNTACGEVSYALVPVALAFDPDGPAGPTPPVVTQLPALIGVNSFVVSASGNPFDPSRSPLLPAGGSLTYVRRLVVGPRNDVASVADPIWTAMFNVPGLPAPLVGTLAGKVETEDGADVEASLLFEGKLAPYFGDHKLPMSQARTDRTGKFSVTLPLGEYTVSVISPERADLTGVKVAVGSGNTTPSLPKLSKAGSVKFAVTEWGNPIPAKLTFVGVEGTKSPDFARFLTAFVTDPTSGQPVLDIYPNTYTKSPLLNAVFTPDGTGKQVLKPGTYRVYASRGLEYTVDIKKVTVVAGQESPLAFNLERVVNTPGYVSADFHVHSGRSFDSSVPLEDRVTSYVAEGVETLVSTDHNFILDLAPVVQKLGLGKWVKTIVGNELTTNLPTPDFPQAFGHHNAFPLLVEPFAPRRGATLTEFVPASVFYDRVRATNPGVEKVVQLNHPRAGVAGLTLIGLFNTISFDPTKPVSPMLLAPSPLGTGTRNIDFDALEICNGNSVGQYQQVRNDWLSLIDQGFYRPGTAVSDSHRLVMEEAGFPRSYVAAGTDDPSDLTDEMITGSVRAGNVMGTSGPYITFDIDGSPMGSLVTKKKGSVVLNITVQAPAWVPVESVRVLANGRPFRYYDAETDTPVVSAPSDPTSNGGVLRFRASVRANPAVDTYYLVEAGTRLPAAVDTDGDGVLDTGDSNGDGVIDKKDHGLVQPPSPPVYSAVAPGFVPLAFTNPIFVDRNGNGRFDAPGIDPLLVPTSKAPIVREPVVERSGEDSFPWHHLRIGCEEMELFLSSLTDSERRMVLAAPR